MPKRLCEYKKCQRIYRSSGYCAMHYYRSLRGGDMDAPPKKSNESVCTINACGRAIRSKGMCNAHYRRAASGTNMDAPVLIRKRAGRNSDSWRVDKDGYVVRGAGRNTKRQHREVMEHVLGRKLVKGENVHHINGVRDDNRPENLELWSTSQPAGQRVSDKIAWAVELLKLYEPDMLTEQ